MVCDVLITMRRVSLDLRIRSAMRLKIKFQNGSAIQNTPTQLSTMAFASEFDGSFLKSLTLDDQDTDEHGYEDDLMEIEFLDDSQEYQDLTKLDIVDPDTHEDQFHHEQPPSEVSENSRMVSILSPTLLGATLAVKRPKLLMPPPSPENTPTHNTPTQNTPQHFLQTHSSSDFDYEFDTQQYQPSQLRQRNTSLYETRDLNQFLSNLGGETREMPMNSTFQPMDMSYNANAFHSYNHNVFPFRMSHTPPNGMSYTFSMHNNNPPNNIPSNEMSIGRASHNNEHIDLLGKSTPNDVSLTKTSNEVVFPQESGQNSQMVSIPHDKSLKHSFQPASLHDSIQHGNSLQGPILPPPWQSNITPVQKLPYMIWSYIQLLSNTVITAYMIYTVYTIVQSIHHDIQLHNQIHQSNMMIDIQECRRAYNSNNCHPSKIVPVLEKQCLYWEKCMNQPIDGNISIITAKIIGTIINNLVEPLGVKFFAYFLTTIIVLYVTNFSFGYIRAKFYYGNGNTMNR
jgi:Predicted membrane protein